MHATIDVVMESGHPEFDAFLSPATKFGGSLIASEDSQWAGAMNASQADWIVLVDRRTAMTSGDLENVLSSLTTQQPDLLQAPVRLHPTPVCIAAERFLFEKCPPVVALCWNNPARYSLVCVQRAALKTLPPLQAGHSEPIWDWLIKLSAKSQQVQFTSSEVARSGDTHCLDAVPGLITREPTPEIGWLVQHIERTKPSQFNPDCDKPSLADSVAIKAGLLLWHDAADASHQLSQSIEGLGKQHAGDYWHAILHRREPDYSNAKYWFRQFHTHPVMFQLPPYVSHALHDVDGGSVWQTRLLGKGAWDPLAFVDFCEACADQENSPLGIAARRIQAAEMQLLLAATYEDASGLRSGNAT